MCKCKYSEYCGGCSLQGIEYNEQLNIKQDYVNKLLSKFCNVKTIIGCENYHNYRNKVQVSFDYDAKHHNIICGNYIPSTHTIVPVDYCMICDKGTNVIINSIKKLINKYKISIFNEHSYKGCMRHLLIRCTNRNEYMLVLVTGTVNINKKEQFIKDIVKFNPNITTIVQNINNKKSSMILGNKNITLYGKGYIVDRLCDLNFRISPSSFYQVNKTQTEVLYNNVIRSAKLNKNDVLLDAYCGTGTIGLVASKMCKEIIGVELNRNAVKDAITNAKINNINNAYFICEDASNYMQYLAKNKMHIDVLIMDPPRTGSDKKFLNAISKLKPKRIVYVSCNPETLVEDLNKLITNYKITYIQPIDMFPFTNHVECVVSMEFLHEH